MTGKIRIGVVALALLFCLSGGLFLLYHCDRCRNFLSTTRAPSAQTRLLPYDRSNHVWYDNDYTNDYVDWYLMALAHNGEITYRGITISSSVAPFNKHVSASGFTELINGRTNIIRMGRDAGLGNAPTQTTPGNMGHLVPPSDRKIDSTNPLNSAGGAAIKNAARDVYNRTGKPMVVVMGGSLTVAADAYLQAQREGNSIGNKLIVAWVGGSIAGNIPEYNSWLDPWAQYVVFERIQVVQFPCHERPFYPRLKKNWIQNNLPESEAKTYLLSLQLDVLNRDDGDGDGMPAAAIMSSDYIKAIKRVSFSHWFNADNHTQPAYRAHPFGKVMVVVEADGSAAGREYERALHKAFTAKSALSGRKRDAYRIGLCSFQYLRRLASTVTST